MIRKLKDGRYRLYSRKLNPKTGKRRNLGTFATRAHQKRAAARVERLLLRDAEPWVALSGLAARADARASLHAAWTTLLATERVTRTRKSSRSITISARFCSLRSSAMARMRS